MKRAIATAPGEPTQYIDLTLEEVAQRAAEEAIITVAPLPIRLLQILQNAAQQITAAINAQQIEPPAPGTFAQIAAISAQLQELARLVPESVYASEAAAVITALGTLPEPLETVRQQVLSEIGA